MLSSRLGEEISERCPSCCSRQSAGTALVCSIPPRYPSGLQWSESAFIRYLLLTPLADLYLVSPRKDGCRASVLTDHRILLGGYDSGYLKSYLEAYL